MSHAAYAWEVPTRWELPDRRLSLLHHRPAGRGHHLRPGPAGTPADGQVLICCARPGTDIFVDM